MQNNWQFVNIAYENYINPARILAVTGADSSPIKRLIAETKENGMLIDCSQGKKTRSVIFLDSDHVVLSALTAEAVITRLQKQQDVKSEKQLDVKGDVPAGQGE